MSHRKEHKEPRSRKMNGKRLYAPLCVLAAAVILCFFRFYGSGGKPGPGPSDPIGTEAPKTEPFNSPTEMQGPAGNGGGETDDTGRAEEKDPLFAGLTEEGKEQVKALQKDGSGEGGLVIAGPLPEETMKHVLTDFSGRTGIEARYLRMSGNDLYTGLKSGELKGKADVWFGSRLDPVAEGVGDSLLLPVDAVRSSLLRGEWYRDPDGCWYAAGEDPLGVLYRFDDLAGKGPGYTALAEGEMKWTDLTGEAFRDGIAMPDPNYSGDGQFLVCGLIKALGHGSAMDLFRGIRENRKLLTPTSAAAAEAVRRGEARAAVCFRSDAVSGADGPPDGLRFVLPEEGTAAEMYVTAALQGAAHPKAAALWTEYVLSGACLKTLGEAGINWLTPLAEQNAAAAAEGETASEHSDRTERDRIVKYDFEDGKERRTEYIEDYYMALAGS